MNKFGLLSQLFFMICLFPQPWHTYKIKHVKGVSWVMWIWQFGGYIFGMLYGLQIHQFPLIFGSSFGMLMSAIFFTLYLKYRKN